MVRQIAFSFDNKHYLPDTDNSAKSPSCPVSTVNPGVEIKHLCDTDDIEMQMIITAALVKSLSTEDGVREMIVKQEKVALKSRRRKPHENQIVFFLGTFKRPKLGLWYPQSLAFLQHKRKFISVTCIINNAFLSTIIITSADCLFMRQFKLNILGNQNSCVRCGINQ